MKKITLSLLATTILSTGFAAGAYAAAPKDPEIYFYPAKSWVVGKASEESKQCAVQSEFNNGFVLQFDGDDQSLQSFSVNFRQNIFNEGQNYDVTLGIPGVAGKTITATATSRTTLTIPLQNEKQIYQSAKTAAVMDVGIDSNNFRFYLVNFSPAAANFESCMAGKDLQADPTAPTQAAPVSVVEAAPAPVPVAETPQIESTTIQPPTSLAAAEEPAPAKQASVQGQIAPPPPNADPDNIMTLNESIALEEQEAAQDENIPVTEILPEDPKPSVQKLAYKETVKLGKPVVKDKTADEMNAEALAKNSPAAAKIAEAKAKVRAPLEANAATSAAPLEATPGQKPYHKRMSEILAEEMSADPSIAAGSPGAAKDDKVANAETVPVEQDDLAPISAKAIEPTVEETKQAFEQPAPVAAPKTGNEPFAKHGEFIDTDTPAPQKQAKKTETFKSPEMIVHKDSRKVDADFTGLDNVEPASNEPFARKADPDMLRKLSELESKISTLEKENIALNDELKSSVAGSEHEKQSIASENWNLERATMRFTEAERQAKRLGEQIAKERAQCEANKKDIEAQLFDPRITDQQQLAKLADLEQKLAAAEQKLEDQRVRYEERIRTLQGPGSARATQ